MRISDTWTDGRWTVTLEDPTYEGYTSVVTKDPANADRDLVLVWDPSEGELAVFLDDGHWEGRLIHETVDSVNWFDWREGNPQWAVSTIHTIASMMARAFGVPKAEVPSEVTIRSILDATH